jgi:hypothetical protein
MRLEEFAMEDDATVTCVCVCVKGERGSNEEGNVLLCCYDKEEEERNVRHSLTSLPLHL